MSDCVLKLQCNFKYDEEKTILHKNSAFYGATEFYINSTSGVKATT